MSELVERFKAARRAAAPLVAITTPDYPAVVDTLRQCLNGSPMIQWDLLRGYRPLNEPGQQAMEAVGISDAETAVAKTANPAEALCVALDLPKDTVLFMHNAQRCVEPDKGIAVIQGVLNLRDPFKNPRRTLVLLTPDYQPPLELRQDLLVLDDPLPTQEQLASIIKECYESAGLKQPAKADPILDALAGLAAFPAEQAVAMSLTKQGIDLPGLWDRKRKMIEQTKGLRINRSKETFSTVGGMEQLKARMKRLFAGPKPPRCVVWIDEIEKALAGSGGGDLSGTSTDQLGVLLTEMQENTWTGFMGVGPPGSGKSLIAKAIGNTFGVLTIAMDLGGSKEKFVGSSEENIRASMKIIKAIGGDRVLWVATANKLDAIPPELKRRFTKGIYFFDLLTKSERPPIWNIYRKQFEIDAGQTTPNDEGWTGANIFACCSTAWEEQCTLAEAAQSIIPPTRSDPEGLRRLREMAKGKFLSVNGPGAYEGPEEQKTSGKRTIEV